MLPRRPLVAPILGFAAVLLLVACAQPPRPFGRGWEDGARDLGRPVTGTTVAVVPVPGLPPVLAQELAEALAAGLAAQEVPARVTPDGGLPGDHRLFGQVLTVEPDPASDTLLVEIALELRDSSGVPVMLHRLRDRVPGALWGSAPAADAAEAERVAARMSGSAATAFARAERALVPVPSGEPEGLHEGGGPTAPPPPREALAVLPRVEVLAVSGAPRGGSNNEVLAAALRSVLRDVGVPLTADAAAAQATVAAVVTLKPVAGDQQEHIRVVWSVHAPDGTEVGVVKQENMLPKGYAEEQWPDLSYLIAGAAVDGIVPLLRQVQERAAAGG